MLRHPRAAYTPLVLIGLAAAALAAGSAVVKTQSTTALPSAKKDVSVFRPGNTKAVVAKRQVHNMDDPRWHQVADVGTLARSSSSIIIGTPVQNVSRFSGDGPTAVTEYRVSVEDVIKGGLQAGDTVTVVLPGGLAKADDGTFVETRTPAFRKMANHRRYVLFLSEDGLRGGVLTPTNGPQGLYELPSDGTGVRHYGRPLNLSPDDPNAPSEKALLAEIRRAAKRP
jgi:hypothetical protein